MFIRDAFPDFEKSLNYKQITVICGLRRTGKTTAVKYLLSKIESNNKVFFDLERVEYRSLFNQNNYADVVKSLEAEGIDFSTKAYIALDEIQMLPNITSVIKYLYDNFDIKFIVTGSVSFYLKNHFNESLSGRKRVYELYTLSFKEFVRFKQVDIKFLNQNWQLINISIYNKLYTLYKEYIEFGGFPEVVLSNDKEQKIALLKDIINSYLRIDIKFLSDLSKSDELYKVIIMLTSRTGSKVDYSKLGSIMGIDRKKLKEYIEFFEQTYIIRQIAPFVSNPDREIALQKKLYFTDNGILNILGKVSSAALLKNAVANQLAQFGSLKYYARKTGHEIDFIVNDEIAIEVKETPAAHDLKQLNTLSESINISKRYLAGLHWLNPQFNNFVWVGSMV